MKTEVGTNAVGAANGIIKFIRGVDDGIGIEAGERRDFGFAG